jgi:hypothetical protein
VTIARAHDVLVRDRSRPEFIDPDSAIRTQLVRLMRDLEPGRLRRGDADHVTLDVLRQLILHTVWLAEEVRVLQDEVDRLNGLG